MMQFVRSRSKIAQLLMNRQRRRKYSKNKEMQKLRIIKIQTAIIKRRRKTSKQVRVRKKK